LVSFGAVLIETIEAPSWKPNDLKLLALVAHHLRLEVEGRSLLLKAKIVGTTCTSEKKKMQ
jgi:hypothetical protein